MQKAPKKPLLLRILPPIFKLLERISPRLSGQFALYLFLHPIKYKRPEREEKCYLEAEKSFLEVEGGKVACYYWGSGPSIWIMHGWSGRATQLSAIISYLVKSGFQVIGVDAPGHGDSEGKDSNVLLFEKSLQAMHDKFGPAYAFIGHSLGGAIGFYAMKKQIYFEKYISISTPAIPELILHEAFDKIGATEKSTEAMCSIIHERIGAPFSEFTATYWAKFAPEIPILLIHDKGDKEAGIEHVYALSKLLPNAETHITQGLGHVRILRDDDTLEKMLHFLRS
jgi:pimeloyl-ACP methyl ester carboxylesterase